MTVAAEIPWAAIGAFFAGVGSFMSGYAALKIAGRGKKNEQNSDSVDEQRPDPGGR